MNLLLGKKWLTKTIIQLIYRGTKIFSRPWLQVCFGNNNLVWHVWLPVIRKHTVVKFSKMLAKTRKHMLHSLYVQLCITSISLVFYNGLAYFRKDVSVGFNHEYLKKFKKATTERAVSYFLTNFYIKKKCFRSNQIQSN